MTATRSGWHTSIVLALGLTVWTAVLGLTVVAKAPRTAPVADTLPDKLTDQEFWKLSEEMSEPNGYFRSENLTSNELLFETVIPDLINRTKPGDVFLGVGPEPNGDIPLLQRDRLLHLGKWLAVNGEAIFSTRPWQRAEGQTASNVPVRFTCSRDSLFAIVLGSISPGPLIIKDLRPSDNTRVALLGVDGSLAWEQRGRDLAISVPQSVPVSTAYVFRIRPNIDTSV
jgi:alpha-L-fucosidase